MSAKINDGLNAQQRYTQRNKEKLKLWRDKWRENNPNYHSEYAQKHKERNHQQWKDRSEADFAKYLFTNAKHRAKKHGVEFNIEIADIVIPDVCPVFGTAIECVISDKNTRNNNIPTLDRIDNTKGYVKGNICVISWRANILKKDASVSEIKAILTYMEAHHE